MLVTEKMELHDRLNPALWNSNNELREDVREKILEIVAEYEEQLQFEINIADIHLVGSNASYNYTKNSDIDVHIIVRFEEDKKELEQYLCSLVASSFNKSYDIKIRGFEVELYVEDIRSTTISNGIYSIVESRWLKFPKKIVPPEYDISDQFELWKKKIASALSDKENISAKTLLDNIYMIRKNSIDIDGEYGKGNQLFKEIRGAGLLQKLKDKSNQEKSKELSLENFLREDNRSKLISKSKSSAKGMQRYNRRVKSSVARTVKQFNSIDMNKIFKDGIVTVNISVNGETDDYVVKISFGGFLEILRDEIKRNGGKLDLRAIMRALVTGFNKSDVYIHCSCCLKGDTVIKLLNGERITVEEMYRRYGNGEKFFVYSSTTNGELKHGEVTDVFVSKHVNDMVRITLDNGRTIETTVDHPYMKRNGEYVRADTLSIGDCLMPTNKVEFIEHVHYDEAIPVYDLTVPNYSNFLVDAGVILHNCDFRYRFGYWATRNNIDSGVPELRPSKITNPHDTLGSACKHVLLVLNNNSWIIKVASVINNYIKYMEKNYEKLYADIIYPAVYGKPYEQPVQTTIFDDEAELASETDTDEVSKAIEQGKKSTQFQKGNVSGVRFANKDDADQISIEDEEEV